MGAVVTRGGFTGAIRFLTRVPLPGDGSHGDPARSVPWFPVVGACVGAAIGAIYAAGLTLWPSTVAAVIAITAGIVLTGAFHEDGLADSADALVGAGDRDDALRILRDPTLGTFGVLALAATFAVRVVTVAGFGAVTAVAALIAAHSLGRAAAVGGMVVQPAAPDGLGAGYARHVGRRHIALTGLAGLVIGVAAMGPWAIAAALGVVLGAIAMTLYARRRLGGITGDILGAIEQVGEMATLLVVAGVVHGGGGQLAWWV